MNHALVTIICLALTLVAYALSRYVGARIKSAFTTPVFFSTVLIVAALSLANLDVGDYEDAKSIITLLLGPATVALAVPLYKNRHYLLGNLGPAVAGVLAGIGVTVVSAVMLAHWLGLSEELARASSLKSVTVAVAVQIGELVEADPALVAGVVIATGMIGAMIGPWLLTRASVFDPVARGIAFGTISHGQGTAQAAMEGELPGAVAGVAMGATAVLSAAIVPVILALVG